MFSEYLQLITEILSAKEYKKYKKEDNKINFKEFSVKEYKKVLPTLKKIFKDLNKGKFARTVIFDYNSLSRNELIIDKNDQELIDLLNEAGYEVTHESYKLGIGLKNNKTVIIDNIVKSLYSKNVEKLIEAYASTQKEEINKQITAINKLSRNVAYKATIPYMLSTTDKYKIVLTIESRKIASQSTKTGWTSCMRFDRGGGEYRQYVMSGIQEGVIIAYLVKTGDEKKLESPSARILIKPLKAIPLDEEEEKNPQIIWVTDSVYGKAPDNYDFKNRVQKIFDKYSSKENGVFSLSNKIYPDNTTSSKIVSGKNLRNVRSFEEFDKLSLKDKLIYSHTVSNDYLSEYDYTKREDARLYYLYCAKLFNSVYTFENKESRKNLLDNLTGQEINELYQLSHSRFGSMFLNAGVIDQKIAIKIIKAENADKKLINALIDKDVLPPIYARKMKKIYKGMPIPEFLKYLESEILSAGNVDIQIITSRSLDELFNSNSDYRKTRKYIVNRAISKLLDIDKAKKNIIGLIERYTNFDYSVFISKDNIAKILDVAETPQTGYMLELGVLEILGANNIIKYTGNKKLNFRNISLIINRGLTINDEKAKSLIYRIIKEDILSDINIRDFISNIQDSIKSKLDYKISDAVIGKYKELYPTETQSLFRYSRNFFLSNSMTVKEKTDLYNKYFKKGISKNIINTTIKPAFLLQDKELYRAIFGDTIKRQRTIAEIFIPE